MSVALGTSKTSAREARWIWLLILLVILFFNHAFDGLLPRMHNHNVRNQPSHSAQRRIQ
jgi:hypothetical protein